MAGRRTWRAFALSLVLVALVLWGTVIRGSSAAEGQTVKLVGAGYTPEATDTVVDLQGALGAAVLTAINGVPDGNALVIVLPGAPGDFEPVVFNDVSFHLTSTFIALKGTIPELLGGSDLTFLFAVQWDNSGDNTPTFSVGAQTPSLKLAAINENWRLPIDAQPVINDAFVAVSTGTQEFPDDAPQDILDFYPEDLSEEHTLEAGAAFAGSLLLKSVIGDNATEGTFGDVDQVVTLKASITVGGTGSEDDVTLLNQTEGTAPPDTDVDVNVHIEAILPLSETSQVGFPSYVTAVGEWKLTLDVTTAEPSIKVSGSGEFELQEQITDPPVRLGASFEVSHDTADQSTEVKLIGETLDPIEDVFGTSLDIEKVKLTLSFEREPGSFTATGTIEGEFDIDTATVNVSISITTEQAQLKIAELVLDVTGVPIGSLFTWAAAQIGFDPQTLPTELAEMELTSAHLRIRIERLSEQQTRYELGVLASVTYGALQLDGLAYLVKNPLITPATGYTIGMARHGSGADPLKLGDLVSSLDGTPFDLELPDVAFGYSNISHPWNVGGDDDSTRQTPQEIVEFFKPIYFPGSTEACEDIPDCAGRQANLDLGDGAFLVSSFMLPDNLGPALDGLWVDSDSPVLLKGELGLFESNRTLSLTAVLPRMSPGPGEGAEWFESGQLAFGVRLNLTTTTFEAFLRGEITVLVPDDTETCGYDRMRFQVEAQLELEATAFEIALTGGLIPAGPAPQGSVCAGDPGLQAWDTPFGQEWLSVNGLALQLGLRGTVTPPSVSITLGFAATVTVGTVDIQGSFALALTPLPALPFVAIEPLGFRFASAAGASFQDVIAFYNQHIALPGAEINLPQEWLEFDVGVRNFELSWASDDKPELCLFEGIRIRGYVYLGAEQVGYTPADAQLCIPGNSANVPEPPAGENVGCAIQENKDHGCFAGVDFTINNVSGLRAIVQIGSIDLGPIHTDDALFDIAANSTLIAFKVSGGMTIENIFAGHIAIGIEPDGFHFLGNLSLFPEPPPPLFTAKVKGQASFSLTNPFFVMDARLASNFGSQIEPVIKPFADRFAATVQVISGFITVLNDPNTGFDDLVQYVIDIPTQLQQLGLGNDPLVAVLAEISQAIKAAQTTASALGLNLSIDSVINYVLQGVHIGTPAVLGSITDFGLWESCFIALPGDPLDCVLIPAIGFDIPGLCPSIVNVPGCSAAGLKSMIVSELNEAVAAVFGVTPQEMLAGLNTIATTFQNRPIVFDVACVGFNLSMGVGDQVSRQGVDIFAKFILLGFDVVVGPLTWDFTDTFANNLSGLGASLGSTFFGPQAPFNCNLEGEDSPDSTPPDEPPSGLTQTGTASVNEGSSVTISGSFDPGTTEAGDTQTVTIQWPTGTETLTVPIGSSSFTSAARSFTDDNPSATSSDVVNVPVIVENDNTGSTSAVFKVTVNNVTPVFGSLSVLPGTQDEGSPITLSGTFNDPGTADTYKVRVTWGDGTQDDFTLAAGSASFSRVHTYRDDEAGSQDDVYPISATLLDDDTGQGTASTSVTVRNVAPTLSGGLTINRLNPDGSLAEANVSELDEGDIFEIVGQLTDPGTADTHVVSIEFGNGEVAQVHVVPASTPSALRPFKAVLAFRDDNPTGTPSDTMEIAISIVDDDGGASPEVTRNVTVSNVAPSVLLTTVPINENETADLIIEITDPGPDDTFDLVVDWGDGSAPLVMTLGSAERHLELAHQYLDDNPTGTPWDVYMVEVTVTDDDTGVGNRTQGQQVNNTPPRVAAFADPVTVQYSDSMPSPLWVAFDDVAADTLTAGTRYTFDGGPSLPGLPAELEMTFDGCYPTTVSGLPDPRQECSWSISGQAHVAPGTYVITITASDDDSGSSPQEVTLIVLPEDARVDYVGPTVVSAPSVLAGYIDVELRATVRDISVVPGIVPPDLEPGDITHAEVTFVDRLTGEVLCVAPVVRIFAADTTTGGASCVATLSTEGAGPSWDFTVGSVVGAWYTRDAAEDDVVVTALSPTSNYLHGGGHLPAGAPAGALKPTTNSRIDFQTKPIRFSSNFAQINHDSWVTFESAGRKYKATITWVDSLGIIRNSAPNQNLAQVEALVDLYDVTNKNSPILVGSGLRIQMRLTDVNAPSNPDSFSFVIWDEDGLMVAAVNWDVVRTAEVVLSGGQVIWKQ
jgi:hypothetical protein